METRSSAAICQAVERSAPAEYDTFGTPSGGASGERVDHGLSPRAARRRRRGQRKHCAAKTAIDSAAIGSALEHAAAADHEISARTIVNVVRVCESRTTLPRSRATWGRRRGQREHHAAGRVPTRGAIEYPRLPIAGVEKEAPPSVPAEKL